MARGLEFSHRLPLCMFTNLPVLEDLNERATSLEEVGEAVNEMKSGNTQGLDGFQKDGTAVLE